MSQPKLFHIISRTRWESLEVIDEKPFLHLCTEEQISGVLERYFLNQNDLLLISVDPVAVEAHLRWEEVHGESFPHLYAPLEKIQTLGFRPIREEDRV